MLFFSMMVNHEPHVHSQCHSGELLWLSFLQCSVALLGLCGPEEGCSIWGMFGECFLWEIRFSVGRAQC